MSALALSGTTSMRRNGISMKQLSVPEKHQLKVARQTLKYSDAGALCMGGPNKAEARQIILRLTGKPAKD